MYSGFVPDLHKGLAVLGCLFALVLALVFALAFALPPAFLATSARDWGSSFEDCSRFSVLLVEFHLVFFFSRWLVDGLYVLQLTLIFTIATFSRGKASNCNFFGFFLQGKGFYLQGKFFSARERLFFARKRFFGARERLFLCKLEGLSLQCAASFCN